MSDVLSKSPSAPIELPGGASLQVLYNYPLPNAAGLKLVSLKIEYAPGAMTERHRHGNAFVGVTCLSGRVQSKVNDAAIEEYGPGETWCENPGDRHLISRNASKTEPAAFIATFVCPIDQKDYVIFDCPACKVVSDAA